MAPDPEHLCRHDPRRARGRVTVHKLTRLRDLEKQPTGTIVLATSHPEPRYFLRHRSGWLACSALGDVTEHMELWAQLEGWPPFLNSRDLRRPATVVGQAERQAAKC